MLAAPPAIWLTPAPHAQFFGVPVALLGLATYLVLLALGLAWWRWGKRVPDWVPLSCAGIGAAGWVFSAYLTWVEAYVLLSYCIWCLISFGLLTALAAVSILGTLRRGAPI